MYLSLNRRHPASDSLLNYDLLLLSIAPSQQEACGSAEQAKCAADEPIEPTGAHRAGGGGGARATPSWLLAARLAARALPATGLPAGLTTAATTTATGGLRARHSSHISGPVVPTLNVLSLERRTSDPTAAAAEAYSHQLGLYRVWNQSSMCVSLSYIALR